MRVAAAGAKERPIRSTFEAAARKHGFSLIAGADEAGRGSLFGPVYAAAVILDKANPIRGLRDSKQLTRERREVLAVRIRERAVAWAVASADATEIDAINIYQASRLAIKRAVSMLLPAPHYLLVDALQIDLEIPQEGIIHGDALSPSIAAASILAKVDRDACLREWHERYPDYGLAKHKGYPTPEHLEALALHGPTPHHRMSYAPVRQLSLFPAGEVWV
jgi:ribonuclease HII